MENILVICAHSDGMVIGPGGTLAKYGKDKKKIHVVICSYGETTHPHFKKEVIIKLREKEAEEAKLILGIKSVKFLGLRSIRFRKDLKEKGEQKIKDIIKKIKPTKIFTHSANDPLPDHKLVNKAVMNAKPRCEIYTFDIWTFMKTRKYPRMIVDISDTFKIKTAALKCFRSNWYSIFLLTLSVYFKAIFNGLKNETKFAEVFDKVK